MKLMIILRGAPGSGKSTLAEKLLDDHLAKGYLVSIHSTDDYWIRPDGYYDWRPDRVREAHLWNYNEAFRSIQEGYDVLIIDNTNTTFKECQKYVELAIDNGYEVEFKEPDTRWKYNVEECAERNTHSVPKESIERMLNRWESTESFQGKYNDIRTTKLNKAV